MHISWICFNLGNVYILLDLSLNFLVYQYFIQHQSFLVFYALSQTRVHHFIKKLNCLNIQQLLFIIQNRRRRVLRHNSYNSCQMWSYRRILILIHIGRIIVPIIWYRRNNVITSRRIIIERYRWNVVRISRSIVNIWNVVNIWQIIIYI